MLGGSIVRMSVSFERRHYGRVIESGLSSSYQTSRQARQRSFFHSPITRFSGTGPLLSLESYPRWPLVSALEGS